MMTTHFQPVSKYISLVPIDKSYQKNPWNSFFEDSELKAEIKKDVERTYLVRANP